MRHFAISQTAIALTAAFLVSGITPKPLWACYAVVVGRSASVDGSVLVGHNEENGGERVLWFHKIPRQPHPRGSALSLRAGGQLDEVPTSWAFLWSENPGLEFSDGYLNEWGVAIVTDSCPSREDGYDQLVQRGQIRDGGIGVMLRRLVAMRAKSASEGVDLIGSLVERFGYVASGRTYVVADPREAWLVTVVRGRHWVAQRVPDDKVVLLPNVSIIGEVDLSDTDHFRGSDDLIDYAASQGWFDSKRGKPFNFYRAYRARNLLGPDERQFRGQEIVSGQVMHWPPEEPLPFAVTPKKKLSPADVVAILRSQDGIAPLFNNTTQESAVFQLRASLPPEIGCIYWRTSSRPDISPLLPWYVGITSTHQSYRPTPGEGSQPVEVSTLLALDHHFHPPAGTFDPDPRFAWWKFQGLAQRVDQDDDERMDAMRDAWQSLERRLFENQAPLESDVLRLWRHDPDAARAVLTRYCTDVATAADGTADRLIGEN